MTIAGIIILILLGILLILLEFLVIPGVTVAGIGGFILMAAGVYMAYSNYGVQAGHITLGSTLVFVGISIYFSLRSRTWKRLMLRSAIDSKVNVVEEDKVKSGDEGICISRLAPMGKVLVNGEFYEAKTMNTFIDQNSEIIVLKIENGKLIVKLKS